MTDRAERILDVILGLDALSDLPRTGWLLRGIRPCESIADHSYAVAIVTMLLVDALRAEGAAVDGERALRMALVHDAAEARTGDIPMPVKSAELDEALHFAEARIIESLLPVSGVESWREAEEGTSLEARVVKAADKIQMMAKATAYERQHRGALDDFWRNAKNFDARDVAVAREVFEAICARAGHDMPRREK